MPTRNNDRDRLYSNIPVPDPSLLTTQQLTREITVLRELFNAQIIAIQSLQDEKFSTIEVQFTERDIRTDAALQSAKEAVAKSEAATTKQIDQIGVIINTLANGLNDKIDDIKSRITVIEGTKKGGTDILGYVFGIVAFITSLIVGFATIWTHKP